MKKFEISYIGEPRGKTHGKPKTDLFIELDKPIPEINSKDLKISLKAGNAIFVENWTIPQRALSIFDKDRLKQTLELERKLEDARKKAITDGQFYEENDECPTCKQGLDEEHKKQHIAERQEKAREIESALVEIETTIEKCKDRIDEINLVHLISASDDAKNGDHIA